MVAKNIPAQPCATCLAIHGVTVEYVETLGRAYDACVEALREVTPTPCLAFHPDKSDHPESCMWCRARAALAALDAAKKGA